MLENSPTQISVIIPTWNGSRFIENCLQSLFQYTSKPLEVIIVDNASTDDTIARIESSTSNLANEIELKVIRNPLNTGFAHAVNQGLNVARGDILLVLNQNMQLMSDWVVPVLNILEQDRAGKIGIIGCKLLDQQGEVSHLGGIVLEPLGEANHYHSLRDGENIAFVSGCTLIITRGCFADLGGFDERFFPAYYEDVDYCLRARQKGWRLAIAAEAIFLHHDSQSSRSAFEKNLCLNTQRLRYLMKHYADAEWLSGNWFPAERERMLKAVDLDWLYALTSALKVVLADVHNLNFFEHLTRNNKKHLLILWATHLDELAKVALHRIETLHLEAKMKMLAHQSHIQVLETNLQNYAKEIQFLERTNAHLSFDNLVTQVKDELSAVFDPVEKQSYLGGHRSLGAQKREIPDLSSLIRANKQYGLHELTTYHDEKFVSAVYYALLGRVPDINGFTHCLNALRQGKITKIQLVVNVLHSSEGRQYGANVSGLKHRDWLRRFYQLPLIGRIAEIGVYLYRLPQLMRQAESIFNMSQQGLPYAPKYVDSTSEEIREK